MALGTLFQRTRKPAVITGWERVEKSSVNGDFLLSGEAVNYRDGMRSFTQTPAGRCRPGGFRRPDALMEEQVDETAFKEVTKERFKEVYFRLGGGPSSGWTADYWQKFYEDEAEPGWRFMVEEPRSAAHDRMWVVTDHAAREHRLFFRTEQDEDGFLEWPGEV